MFQEDKDFAERFYEDEPRQEFALKTSHDKEDLIEVPKFVNLPSDQGILTAEEGVEPLSDAGLEGPDEERAEVGPGAAPSMAVAEQFQPESQAALAAGTSGLVRVRST